LDQDRPVPSQLHSAWRAIGHFLGEDVPLPRPVDADLLAEVARVHRLEGALAEARLAVRTPEPHVPLAVWERWRTAHATGLAQAIRREAPLRAALAALEPIPAVVLKGAALADLVYPSPGARPMGDVDLLVPAARLDAALARLVPLGYTRKYPGHRVLDAPGFHERQLEGPMELDLHQAFIQPERLAIDYPGIFERALPWPTLASNAFVLAPADAVVHACLHAAIGELTPTWSPAIGLLDLRLMLGRRGPLWGDLLGGFGEALDPPALAARARDWGAERMLHGVLELARSVFPSIGARIDAIGTSLPASVRLLLEAAIVRRAAPPRLTDPTRAEVLLRKALFLNPRDRIRFGMHALEVRG
jgi:hypothetical protein